MCVEPYCEACGDGVEDRLHVVGTSHVGHKELGELESPNY